MEFEIRKGRFSFRLTAPYSEERRRAASEAAKKHSGIERKKISAVNVPNGVSDVPIGTSQFCRCCATIKSEKVSATNDRLLSLVHRMFTNTYPAFCRGNVRCKVKGGLEQQRARFYRGARFRISLILSHQNLVGECLPQTLLYAA